MFGPQQCLLGRVMGWATGRFLSTKHAFSFVVLTPSLGASAQQTPKGVYRIEGQHLRETVCHCRRASWDPDRVAVLHADASLTCSMRRRMCRVTQGHSSARVSFPKENRNRATGHQNASSKRARLSLVIVLHWMVLRWSLELCCVVTWLESFPDTSFW